MKNASAILLLLSAVVALGAPLVASAQPSINLRAVPSTVRVRPTGSVVDAEVATSRGEMEPVRLLVPTVDGNLTAWYESADLACARGEVESAQIVVTAVGGNLTGLNAEASPLRNADGAELPAGCVTLFREVFIKRKNFH